MDTDPLLELLAMAKAQRTWNPEMAQSWENWLRMAKASIERDERSREAREAKKDKRTVPLDSLLDEPTTPDSTEAIALRDEVDALLLQLTLTQAKLLRMRYLMGQSMNEVADSLEVSYQTAKNLLQKAREAARSGSMPE
jgi:RNA polymerase sigma factor (sigma-70 family)